jgi:hypothetical protein
MWKMRKPVTIGVTEHISGDDDDDDDDDDDNDDDSVTYTPITKNPKLLAPAPVPSS